MGSGRLPLKSIQSGLSLEYNWAQWSGGSWDHSDTDVLDLVFWSFRFMQVWTNRLETTSYATYADAHNDPSSNSAPIFAIGYTLGLGK